MSSNYQREVPGVTGITGWYQVPGTMYESTVCMYENIWHVQVPGSPVAYVWIHECVPFVTYGIPVRIYAFIWCHDFL